MTTIISVSNAEELKSALAAANGGDTIELAGGDYGDLFLVDGKTDFNVRFDTPVTITSVNSDAPAIFSEMGLHGASNIIFDNVVFDYEFSSDDPSWHKPFQVNSSQNITIKNSAFLGDLAEGISNISDGFGYSTGLSVRNAQNISIENNEFTSWALGAGFGDTDGLKVLQNEFHDIQRDGTTFTSVTSVLIEGNHYHDFRDHPDSTAHSDFIQFWTNGTDEPSKDIIIRSNILDIGEGGLTQSIFMRNEEVDTGRAGQEMFYQNILIENNTIYNSQTHGITVGETNGLTVQNNTVLRAGSDPDNATASITIPKITVKPASTSVTIEGNVTGAIDGYDGQADWTVGGNAIIQPSEYLDYFITSTTDLDHGTHSFTALPFGSIENLGAGSSHLQFSYAPENLTAQFQVHSDESSATSLIFDASLTVGPLGPISESDAAFLWTFEDGSTATGRVVQHDFSAAGYHDVTLTVVAQDGTKAQSQFTAGIAGDGIVQFDAQAGLFETLAYGEETALDGSGLPLQNTAEGYALKLGGEGKQASVAATELSQFFGTDNFEMSMSLKADSGASWGEVTRVHTSFTAIVDQNGNFRLDLFLDDGSRVHLISEGIELNDGTMHDVAIRFDGKAGFAEVVIDDKVVASEAVFGSIGGGARSLDFGNPWGKQNFDGELSAFALTVVSSDFTIFDGQQVPVSSTQTSIPGPDATPETDPTVAEPVEDPTVAEPVKDPTVVEPVEEPVTEEESRLPEPLLNGGYQLDFASVATSDTVKLHDDTHLVVAESGSALAFDGKKDFVSLGRLTEFEASQKIAFSIDFINGNAIRGSEERLVWNHSKLGLTLDGDGLRVHANNTENHFSKGFVVNDLGLNDENLHNVTVMVDAETDRLQVVVNDVLVLDEQDTDFDLVGAGGHEWGWSLGTGWNRWFEGDVHGFQVSNEFEFIETETEAFMGM